MFTLTKQLQDVDRLGQAGEVLESAIIDALNEFIEPSRVTGIMLFEDERRDLARHIKRAVEHLLERQK